MRRRSKATGEPAKTRRGKTVTSKRGNAPKAVRRRVSAATSQQTKVARLVRERDEALERQAAAANENVRLRNELRESLQQKIVAADVLNLISRSTFNLPKVLQTLVEFAGRLCEADKGVILRPSGKQESYYVAASYHQNPQYVEYLKNLKFAPGRGSVVPRVLLEGKSVQISDVLADPEYSSRELASVGDFRTVLGVPLLRDGVPIGVLVLHRAAVRPFTEKQIKLVETFADQAVIAIENVRLFEAEQERTRELTESLEQQTATSEVLQVISSSPGDLEPVFRTMVEKAVGICDASFGNIYRWDGDALRIVTSFNTPAAFVEQRRQAPFRPSPINPVGQMVASKETVHVHNAAASEAYRTGDPVAVASVEIIGLRTFLAVPMLKDNELVGAFTLGRQEIRDFSERQIALVTSFASQAVIAIENARLLSELRQSLEQQTATSEVLGVISRSKFDLQPVLQSVVDTAARLCRAEQAGIYRLQDGNYRGVAASGHGIVPAYYEIEQRELISPGPGTVVGRAAMNRDVVQIMDAWTDPLYEKKKDAELGGVRSMIGVPLMHDGRPIGVIALARTRVEPFVEREIELVKNFADQAVIAIENTRLLNELRKSLQQQTATAEVLQVISSVSFDLQTVLDTLVESGMRLCEADAAAIWRSDGGVLKIAAGCNLPTEFWEFARQNPISSGTGTVAGRALLEARTIHIPDVEADSETTGLGYQLVDKYRSYLAVPLSRKGETIGVFSVVRFQVRPFTEKQIELIETFADQAVIAIENVRLFEAEQERTRELTESLEQQTATSKVLQVISSSPGDLEPVFAAMLQNAVRICDAKFGNIYRWDGEAFRLLATCNTTPAFAEARKRLPIRPTNPNGIYARMLAAKATIHFHDAASQEQRSLEKDHPNYEVAIQLGHMRTALAIPMLKDNEVIGAFGLSRQEVRPFTDKQIELVTNFAAQAVIAIENARLLTALRERTDELGSLVQELRALGEVSQSVNSTLDLEIVLSTIVTKAVQLSGTDAGAIYVFDEGRGELRLRATHGMDQELIDALGHQHIRLDQANLLPGAAGEPVQVADLRHEAHTELGDIILRAGYRARLIAPLVRGDEIIGILVVRRKTTGAFPQNTVDLMKTFAAQSTLAIQNARLFREIEEKSRQLAEASKHKSQFLANMSHELRTPLNAILGYTELMADGAYGEPSERMIGVLKRLESNGKHLLGLINDVLDLSKIEAGQLELDLTDYSLEDIAHTVHGAVEPLAADKKLRFTTEVTPGLPRGRGDERRLTQVLLNLVGNAIKFTDEGEVAIKVSLANGAFNVAVHDTGPGISIVNQAKLFQEFQQADNSITKKKGGTGLGLAISKRIIEMHGGRIWVDSTVGQGTIFAFTLPVHVAQQVESA